MGYYDPQYGWVETKGLNTGEGATLGSAVDAVFNPPQKPGGLVPFQPVAAGQDPRYPYDPTIPTPALPTRAAPAQPPVVVAATPSGVVPRAPGFEDVSSGSSHIPDVANDVRAGFSIDRSRGLSGRAWIGDHPTSDSEVVRAPSTGPHTQGELEGLANARRMIEAAYGPTHEAFDPVEAQVESLNDQAKLKLATERAADPVAFARTQAEIPAQAQTEGRLAGGERLAKVFGSFDDQLQQIERKRMAMRSSPQYQAATPQARKQADERLDAEAAHVNSSLRVMQQAMGFATGQTPASLYAEQFGR